MQRGRKEGSTCVGSQPAHPEIDEPPPPYTFTVEETPRLSPPAARLQGFLAYLLAVDYGLQRIAAKPSKRDWLHYTYLSIRCFEAYRQQYPLSLSMPLFEWPDSFHDGEAEAQLLEAADEPGVPRGETFVMLEYSRRRSSKLTED